MTTTTHKPPKSITVIGRRWFHRGPGNTYFSAQVYVNGDHVHTIPYEYGYGDQYLQSAFEWLEKNDHIEPEHYPESHVTEPPWQ